MSCCLGAKCRALTIEQLPRRFLRDGAILDQLVTNPNRSKAVVGHLIEIGRIVNRDRRVFQLYVFREPG